MRCETHQLDLGDGFYIDWEPSDCPYCRIQELEHEIEISNEDIRQLRLQFCPEDKRPICIAIGTVIKELERQHAECKLDLCMAITKEQDLVDAEIEIANMKAQNALLFDALKKIANKKWIVEHRPASEMRDIASAALKEIVNG